MKKKIKDLTREECEKICDKQCGNHLDCPFYVGDFCFLDEMFKEVEIDE